MDLKYYYLNAHSAPKQQHNPYENVHDIFHINEWKNSDICIE